MSWACCCFCSQSADYGHSDVLITFWDGKSTGTKHTIDYAKKQQKPLHVCQFDKNPSAKLPQLPTNDPTSNEGFST